MVLDRDLLRAERPDELGSFETLAAGVGVAALAELGDAIARTPDVAARYEPRWLAIQLLEQDEAVWSTVQTLSSGAALCEATVAQIELLEATLDEECDVLLADTPLEEAVQTYYAMMGWDDETGVPTLGKLRELDIERAAENLTK